jgi:hypothetical protein
MSGVAVAVAAEVVHAHVFASAKYIVFVRGL